VFESEGHGGRSKGNGDKCSNRDENDAPTAPTPAFSFGLKSGPGLCVVVLRKECHKAISVWGSLECSPSAHYSPKPRGFLGGC
jgi:hypothetical protein